jgi:hypothetical protein
MTTIVTCGHVLGVPRPGWIRIEINGLLDEYEFEMPTPPGLPEWTRDYHVFMADLDEDVTTVAQLQARPDALRNFRHAGSWPPPAPEDLQFDEENNPIDREGNPL